VVLLSSKRQDNNVFTCILYIFSIIDPYQKSNRAAITREAGKRKAERLIRITRSRDTPLSTYNQESAFGGTSLKRALSTQFILCAFLFMSDLVPKKERHL
jgi:hypothetical protein